jgi:hypothetical protein
MEAVKRLYFAICKRWGPEGMTLSAWAYQREIDGRGYLLREFIDDFFLCFLDQEDHCFRQYLRETTQ